MNEVNPYREQGGLLTPHKLPDTFLYDEGTLLSYGFTPTELNYFKQHIYNFGTLSKTKLMSYGVAPNYADLFMYIYNLCCGRVNNGAGLDLTGVETLSKHLKMLFKCRYLTGDPTKDLEIQKKSGFNSNNLPASLYTELPRRVEIVGIPNDSKFSIFNSDRYSHFDKLYVVKPGTNMGQNITVQTDKQPRLAYREKRELEGVLKLSDMDKAGVSDLVINRDYVRMHNVFYITVGTGTIPEEHYGATRIVAFDGTIINVRVEVWIPRATMTKKVENKHVYEIGYFPEEIEYKLNKITKQLCKAPYVNGVYIEQVPATLQFTTITEEEPEDEIIIE